MVDPKSSPTEAIERPAYTTVYKDGNQEDRSDQGQFNLSNPGACSGTNSNNSDRNITCKSDSQPPQPNLSNKIKTIKQNKARAVQTTEKFSLRTWIRNAPWSQYFKNGCRLIIKTPFNFLIFFCCLSVVVWGAFLVLLMGNMVKLADDATQKLWIEIASQVLNGFFTLANVPVHPKRLLGFIRGLRVWREDNAIRQQFVNRFLDAQMERKATTGLTREEHTQELLRMLEFYRCFPEYGHSRREKQINDEAAQQPKQTLVNSSSRFNSIVPATVRATAPPPRLHSESNMEWHGKSNDIVEGQHSDNNDLDSATLQSNAVLDIEKTSNRDDSVEFTPSRNGMSVGIAEEVLQGLLAEETHRVVQSVVLPFLPFPMGAPGMNSPRDRDLPMDIEETMQEMEQREGSSMSQKSPTSPQSRRTIERGSSYGSLSRMPTKRTLPRTRARTMSMSVAKRTESSTFVIHDDQDLPSGSSGVDRLENEYAFQRKEETPTSKQPMSPASLIPMPLALTKEQMDWVDSHQVRLLQLQNDLQKAWPWYSYTIPDGIEPVDFFALPAEQPAPIYRSEGAAQARERSTTDSDGSIPKGGEKIDIGEAIIMFSSSPSDLVIAPSRYCLIVGSFNINSIVQEILCGFMWGMNYHVRPGWVVGTGMAVGCLAAILPSVLIMLHEHAMSQIRVIATTEEAIQDVLDEKDATRISLRGKAPQWIHSTSLESQEGRGGGK